MSETILEEAARVVSDDRGHHYGPPHVNHARTAKLWSAYLGHEITAEQVCMLNILQKIGRSMHQITRDTLVDIAGYARNVEMIADATRDGAA